MRGKNEGYDVNMWAVCEYENANGYTTSRENRRSISWVLKRYCDEHNIEYGYTPYGISEFGEGRAYPLEVYKTLGIGFNLCGATEIRNKAKQS